MTNPMTFGRWLAIAPMLVVLILQVGCERPGADQRERIDRLELRVDRELGRLEPRLELDWDVVVPIDEAGEFDMPPLEGAEDCNENLIDDRYDRAQYVPRGPYDVGNQPWELAAGDLNGDNLLDLVVSNYSDGTVTVLYQDTRRRFEPELTLDVQGSPSCVVVRDFDADGDLDIAVGHAPPEVSPVDPPWTISMLLNEGNRRTPDFRSVLGQPFSGDEEPRKAPRCIIAAEIAGEAARTAGPARWDLVVTSGTGTDTKVSLIVNTGNGVFAPPQHNRFGYPTPPHRRLDGHPYGLLATDWDNESDPDLIVAGGSGETNIAFLENEPEFTRWRTLRLDTGGAPQAIATANLAGDDNDFDDLAIVNSDSGDVAVVINRGHLGGVWDMDAIEPARYPVGGGAQDIAVADMDNDGDVDIAVPVPDENKVVILGNNGSGEFVDSRGAPVIVELPVRGAPRGILAADLDLDGRIELAVANRDSGKVWVLHRRANTARMPFECMGPRTVRRPPNE